MRFGIEKPAWQIAFVIVLLALLGTLATLQYRWLGQVSQGERERMHASLVTGAERFGQDFDREITRAFVAFRLGDQDPGKDVSATLVDRYDRWQKSSNYPGLVKEIYYISYDHDRNPTIKRFDRASETLAPVEWPADLAKLQQRLTVDARPEDLPEESSEDPIDPVQSDIPLLLAPMIVLPGAEMKHEEAKTKLVDAILLPSYVAIRLDPQVIKEKLLPELSDRYFKGTNGLDYMLNVVTTDTPQFSVFQTADLSGKAVLAGGDTTVGLFTLRLEEPDTFRFSSERIPARIRTGETVTLSSNKHAGAKPTAGRSPATIPDSHGNLVVRIFNKQANIEFKSRGANPDTGGHWQLIARHRSGSLDTFIANTKRRNLFISFGVLLLLAASVGFVLLAARRSQSLAQRQLEFVSSVSHEFRTPLAVICSAGENLADGIIDGPAQVKKYGALVRGEGRRLTEMVEQIMEFAGVQSGRKAYHLTEVTVAEIIDDALTASESLLVENAIEVVRDVAPNLPPVMADAMALRQSLQNLIGNAVKYGGSGNWIGITATVDRGPNPEIAISIADHGIGITEQVRAHIFEPFYRAAEVVDAQIHGNGLGLSLVQRVMQAHHGRVIVKSEPGRGSVFTLYLPLSPDAAVAADPAANVFASLPTDESVAR